MQLLEIKPKTKQIKRKYYYWKILRTSKVHFTFAQWMFTLCSFTIVWLCLSIASSVAPITSVSLSCWSYKAKENIPSLLMNDARFFYCYQEWMWWIRTNFSARSRPKPSIFIWWLQIWPIASSKVTFTSGRPNVAYISTWKSLFDEFIFLNEAKLNIAFQYSIAVMESKQLKRHAKCPIIWNTNLWRFQWNSIHTMATTNVTGIKPINL